MDYLQVPQGLFHAVTNQFADLFHGSDEHQHAVYWGPREVVEQAIRFPVTLAFRLPEVAQEYLDEHAGTDESIAAIPLVEWLPPPQWGEVALVHDQGRSYPIPIDVLGREGLELFQRIGQLLRIMVAPSDWWIHHSYFDAYCTKWDYERKKVEILARMRQSTDVTWRDELELLEEQYHRAKLNYAQIDNPTYPPRPFAEHMQMLLALEQRLTELYWRAYQQTIADKAAVGSTPSLSDQEHASAIEQLQMMRNVPATSAAVRLVAPVHAPDTAIREAALASKEQWITHEEQILHFRASNSLDIYISNPEHPIPLQEAQAMLVDLSDTTAVTLRIAIGLWNLRRYDSQLSMDGAVAIRYDEILEWQGAEKLKRAIFHGATTYVTEGYRTQDRRRVKRDLLIGDRLYILGDTAATVKGKTVSLRIRSRYLTATTVTQNTLWGDEQDIGVFITAGQWLRLYEEHDNHFWAHIDRRVFQLRPRVQQHELRIALYLVERWRQLARERNYDKPITMLELLKSSVIAIDRKNLTNRFAGRIEQALQTLKEQGIIGKAVCLTFVDQSRGKWGVDWLNAEWQIRPPEDLIQTYVEAGITQPQLTGSRKRKPKSSPKGAQDR